ncbi:OR5BC protein, partial [Crocuta crocuta]
MPMENSTEVTEFILVGLTNGPKLLIPLFLIFSFIYLVTLTGNLGMMVLILLDSHLHSPMYFFLSNLSLVDFGYSTAVTPKVMAGLLIGDEVISYNACVIQFFFFVAFITVESFLLALMTYDRYVAVCKPLHYTSTMTTSVCVCLVMGCHICGFLNASIHTGNIFRLTFCRANNSTKVNEFRLLGLTDNPELQVFLFITFTLIYLTTLIGNLGMITLILLDSRLHTPMYIFLSNLSLVDCVYSSAVTPKVMAGFLTRNKVISYGGCAAQMFFFVAFASVDCFLLAVMAYDRHAAVCKPLHYTTTVTTSLCAQMAVGCYVWGFTESAIHTGFTFSLSFCRSNVVPHFFCDIPPILALSCSDIYINEIVLFILAAFNVCFALIIILTSYLFIFIAILRMRSAEGQKKAFSTCASHFTAV